MNIVVKCNEPLDSSQDGTSGSSVRRLASHVSVLRLTGIDI